MQRLLPLLLVAFALPVWAQPADDPAHMNSGRSELPPLSPMVEMGELRLDGRISGVVDAGGWQLDALSWTSSAGKTTTFAKQKVKPLRVGERFFAHFEGQRVPLVPGNISVGANVAVIGRNRDDNSLEVREIVVFRPQETLHPANTETSNLCVQARKAWEKGDWPGSIEFSTRALEAARKLNDSWGERLSLRWRGGARFQALQIDAALADYKLLEDSAHAAGDTQGEAQSLFLQSQVLLRNRQYTEALKRSLAALALRPPNLTMECDIRAQIAREYMALRRNDEAIAMIETVLPLSKVLKNHDRIADQSFNLAMLRAFKKDATLNTSIDAAIVEGRYHLNYIRTTGRQAELRFKAAKLLWYRDWREDAQKVLERACVDFELAKRSPEAQLARASLQKWKDGKSPFDTNTK